MDKEDPEKSIDYATDQEREYAQNALNEFNEYEVILTEV